jgi:phosphopantothenoylcysteine synthetase/decarboxylase
MVVVVRWPNYGNPLLIVDDTDDDDDDEDDDDDDDDDDEDDAPLSSLKKLDVPLLSL